MDLNEELKTLENISKDYSHVRSLNYSMIKYTEQIFSRYMKGGSVLELGPAEGLMTEVLFKKYNDITLVEGSENFCKKLKMKYPSANVVNSLFERFQPNRQYENIILGHVLEHVTDPVHVLTLVRRWLTDKGKVFAAVPNSHSLHRQVGVIMGLLSHEKELNESDLYHGHRRVYDPESFRSDFLAAGLKIDTYGGYWLKPLSNQQIQEHWDEKLIDAFFKLGEKYPDIAADLYIIASK
nr:class I SAM-dependent methyltransferase [Paenibacillus elgii]